MRVWTLKDLQPKGSMYQNLNGLVLQLSECNDDPEWAIAMISLDPIELVCTLLKNDINVSNKGRDIWTIKLTNGTILTFINVECLIPTRIEPDEYSDIGKINTNNVDISDVTVLNEGHISNDYNGCRNGYDGTEFIFNRRLSYAEFLVFCKNRKMNLHGLRKHKWYENHPELTYGDQPTIGCVTKENVNKINSQIWRYNWISIYTDKDCIIREER